MARRVSGVGVAGVVQIESGRRRRRRCGDLCLCTPSANDGGAGCGAAGGILRPGREVHRALSLREPRARREPEYCDAGETRDGRRRVRRRHGERGALRLRLSALRGSMQCGACGGSFIMRRIWCVMGFSMGWGWASWPRVVW